MWLCIGVTFFYFSVIYLHVHENVLKMAWKIFAGININFVKISGMIKRMCTLKIGCVSGGGFQSQE